MPYSALLSKAIWLARLRLGKITDTHVGKPFPQNKLCASHNETRCTWLRRLGTLSQGLASAVCQLGQLGATSSLHPSLAQCFWKGVGHLSESEQGCSRPLPPIAPPKFARAGLIERNCDARKVLVNLRKMETPDRLKNTMAAAANCSHP